MKERRVKDELKKLSQAQLIEKVDDLRREYFTLKLGAVTAPVKDASMFKKLRKNVARALTLLKQ